MVRYWLSFDLGFMSDHERLFEWLDSNEAKECGENVATFLSKKSKSQIAKELGDLVDKECRLYLIDMKSGGKFVLGKRKRKAPWDGYAGVVVEVEDSA
jgi:hypothetical protein